MHTTGVVLVLKDLNLTSTTGATLSVNKGAEAKIIVSGSVKLTDAENPADENSTDDGVNAANSDGTYGSAVWFSATDGWYASDAHTESGYDGWYARRQTGWLVRDAP